MGIAEKNNAQLYQHNDLTPSQGEGHPLGDPNQSHNAVPSYNHCYLEGEREKGVKESTNGLPS